MNRDSLREIAEEIVDRLSHRWPWEDPHKYDIEYVLRVLDKVFYRDGDYEE